jgi:Thioesterase-like superfamily
MSLAPGFFRHEGGRYLPTGRGVSPWNGHSLGGVAIAGLAAHLIDRTPTLAPMHPARLTIDLFGAVPMEPLTPRVSIVREGRRIQMVDVVLEANGRTWARASALRMRIEETPRVGAAKTYAFPSPPFDLHSSEMGDMIRLQEGDVPCGKGARWVRFPHPVVVGQPLGALEAVAMIADFGSGVSPMFSMKEWTFANLDISIHLTRLPRGDWLLIDAETESSGNGIAIARGRLGDVEGMIGTSHQTVFLGRR